MGAYLSYSEKSLDTFGEVRAASQSEIASIAHCSLTSLDFKHGMSLNVLLSEFSNGDMTSWKDEFEWIFENHADRLEQVMEEVHLGKSAPIDICFNDMRVVDGHHRILAYTLKGLTMIVVRDAWHKGKE
jgi:hypothetical protein